MGKKRKHSHRNNSNNNQSNRCSRQRQNKKQRRNNYQQTAYWIEDFRESQGDVSDAALTVLVTRVELVDHHTHNKRDHKQENDTKVEDVTDMDKPNATEEAPVTAVESTEQEETTSNATADPSKFDDKQEDCDERKSETSKVLGRTPAITEIDTTAQQVDGIRKKSPSSESSGNKLEEEAKASDAPLDAAEAILAIPSKEKETKKPNNNNFVCLRRGASAQRKKKKFKRKNFKPLPDGDCGDGIRNPFPKHIVDDKYWAQRHRLFSKFDQGIELDRESWYSVTPEAIALHIAKRIVLITSHEEDTTTGLIVLDAFCGAGGNAIALARQEQVALVICVDLDKEKLKLAAHNANIYDIPDNKLLFLRADACDVLQHYRNGALNQKELESDTSTEENQLHGFKTGGIDLLPENIHAVFLSPPWGGTDYERIGPKKYDLNCIQMENSTNGEQLLGYAHNAVPQDTGSVTVFLPRNTNGLELGRSAVRAGVSGIVEMEQALLNHKFKAITVYMRRD